MALERPRRIVFSAELDAAHARINELEDEVMILRKTAAAIEAVVPLKEAIPTDRRAR